jgi:Zn finger protein HypA/HybF involved in hydrogenase expression
MTKRLTTDEFVEKARAVHGSLYSYAKTTYQGAHKKVVITCNLHGDFEQAPDSHIRQRSGCPDCGEKARRINKRSSQEDFIQACKKIHGDRYDYSCAVYAAYRTKVKIKCKVHGEFEQYPSDHYRGSGCPSCAQSGYRVGRPSWIYILSSGQVTKVGITNRNVEQRIAEIRRYGGPKFTKIFSLYSEDGQSILNTETAILKFLSSTYERTSELHQGSTECFLNVDVEDLINRVHLEIDKHLPLKDC